MRKQQKIDGPLFLGMNTHALSVPALAVTLEAPAANGVEVMVSESDRRTGERSGFSEGGTLLTARHEKEEISMNQKVQDTPRVLSGENVLSEQELHGIDAYWRACNYLSLGMLYLRDNPLLREPLRVEHLKQRLLGHWGSDPGQSFIWVHLNRLIKKYDLNMIYISGPGHGAPSFLANSYLEGRYSEVYP